MLEKPALWEQPWLLLQWIDNLLWSLHECLLVCVCVCVFVCVCVCVCVWVSEWVSVSTKGYRSAFEWTNLCGCMYLCKCSVGRYCFWNEYSWQCCFMYLFVCLPIHSYGFCDQCSMSRALWSVMTIGDVRPDAKLCYCNKKKKQALSKSSVIFMLLYIHSIAMLM